MTDFLDKIKAVYQRANDLSGGSLDILRETFQRFNDARASEAAAGMAYYALFSLFPLLLALVAAGSFFLESERAYREVVDFVTEAIPVSRGLIERNIRRVLELRGTVGFDTLYYSTSARSPKIWIRPEKSATNEEKIEVE
jgi:membrane protein